MNCPRCGHPGAVALLTSVACAMCEAWKGCGSCARAWVETLKGERFADSRACDACGIRELWHWWQGSLRRTPASGEVA